MALFSTSHPVDCEFVDTGRQNRLTLIRLPRATFPLAGGRADRWLGEPLPTRSGPGLLLTSYLTQLPAAARGSAPAGVARLGVIAVDLAATVLAGGLGAHDVVPDATRKRVLLARVHAFIDCHLSDPDLRPTTIAAHHHISLRTLHALFRGEPETVAVTIRRRRLERCHTDLADPSLRQHSIGEIATRWGLRANDFSRMFRDCYGATPHEVRKRAHRSDHLSAG